MRGPRSNLRPVACDPNHPALRSRAHKSACACLKEPVKDTGTGRQGPCGSALRVTIACASTGQIRLRTRTAGLPLGSGHVAPGCTVEGGVRLLTPGPPVAGRPGGRTYPPTRSCHFTTPVKDGTARARLASAFGVLDSACPNARDRAGRLSLVIFGLFNYIERRPQHEQRRHD